MKRLTPSLLPLLFALALVIPAGAAPPLASRPQAALLPTLPRLSALPGLPPAAAAPWEGQGETEREFYGLLRDFESADQAYRALTGSLEQSETDQRRRELYDRGIGILTREGALLDSSPASLEQFALEMDALYSPAGHFTLKEQLRGYATLYAWRAFTEATQRELARETNGRRVLERADGFAQRYEEHGRRRAGPYPPSGWLMEAYAAVRNSAYQAAILLLAENDLASGGLSWREAEDLAYGLEPRWLSTPKGSEREGFYYRAMTQAFAAAFSGFERELVSGRLNEADIAATLERAGRRIREEDPGAGAYASQISKRILDYRTFGR